MANVAIIAAMYANLKRIASFAKRKRIFNFNHPLYSIIFTIISKHIFTVETNNIGEALINGGITMNNRALNWVMLTLVLIGAINWGLVGFFQYDLIAGIFGGVSSMASRIVYSIIGLAGLYSLSLYARLHSEHREHHRHHRHAEIHG